MTRYLFTLPHDRAKVLSALNGAPDGTRVEFKGERRTLPQNDRMWAMLTDVSTQKEHCGRKYTPDQWKVLFMHACGREVQFIPALDGSNFIPWGQSSRDLSKQELSEMIEFMFAWGAENGVEFHEPASGIMAPREPDAVTSDDLLARPEAGQAASTMPPAPLQHRAIDEVIGEMPPERQARISERAQKLISTAGATEGHTEASDVGRAADAGQASSGPLSKFKEYWFAINDIGAFNPKHVATAARDFARSRQPPNFTAEEHVKFERLRTIRLNVLAGVYSGQEGEEKAGEVIGQ